MELEEKSFATKKEFIFGKESRLTNCKEGIEKKTA